MVALITGCSSGMGRELCKKLKKENFGIIATARNIKDIEDIDADDLLELDITNYESISKVYDFVKRKYGKLDVLVNNAGISVRGAIEEIDVDSVRNMFDVNVFGMLNMLKTFASLFREAHSGRIINIGSVSGRYTQAANGCYCASKHAVEALTEAFRAELKPFNVFTTVIEPGPVRTQFFKKVSEKSDKIMNNKKSPYTNIYQKSINKRDSQKNTTAEKAASEICKIIMGRKLHTRYFIAMNWLQRLGIKCLEIIK